MRGTTRHRPCGALRVELHSQKSDGSIDISRALEVNTEFDLSRQLWVYLVKRERSKTRSPLFIPCPT